MTGPRPRRAVVVCDLGFGDAGKGRVVDWLTGRLGARWVIRWNGGAQAGHNVVRDDGRHHTFSQLSAGTFHPGVRTFLGPEVVLHPGALLVEVERLQAVGVPDALGRLAVSGAARLVTPMHQAVNRLRELCRAPDERHGTCGVGVGEAVRHSLILPDEVPRARHLRDRAALLRRARAARQRLQGEARALLEAAPPSALQGEGGAAFERERAVLDDASVVERWVQLAHGVGERITVVGEDDPAPFLSDDAPLLLEGAQGVLLDEWRGFHPHTTWSSCTAGAADALLSAAGFHGEVLRLGVLRSYAVRHGPGPLPTEEPDIARALPEPHNGDAGWQGRFRTGWLDLPLLRYALAVAGGPRPIDALAITHLDSPPRLGRVRAALDYRLEDNADARQFVVDPRRPMRAVAVAPAPAALDGEQLLAYQERLGRSIGSVTPGYVDLSPASEPLMTLLESSLGVEVALASSGTRTVDVEVRHAAL